MSVEWTEAADDVIELAERIIDRYHAHLKEVRIAIIMRSEAPVAGGRVTYGKARKVSAEQQVHIPFDFVIWLAKDRWDAFLTPLQKEALLDHELSHCEWDGINASLRGHDVEEFNHIIERYGLWWPQSDAFETAVQHALPMPREQRGGIGTMKLNGFAREVAQTLQDEGVDVRMAGA